MITMDLLKQNDFCLMRGAIPQLINWCYSIFDITLECRGVLWKNSSIRRTTRIPLAVYSLIEMMISFLIVFYFLCLFNQINPSGIFPVNNEIVSTINYRDYVLRLSKGHNSMLISNTMIFE